mgnify:FL=1
MVGFIRDFMNSNTPHSNFSLAMSFWRNVFSGRRDGRHAVDIYLYVEIEPQQVGIMYLTGDEEVGVLG